MVSIPCDHQHKRLYLSALLVPCVNLQGNLCVLMQADAVFKLDPVQFFLRIVRRVKILPCGNGRLLHKTVIHCPAQAVLIDHVLKLPCPAALGLWRCRHFDAKYRVQLVNDLHPPFSPVVVRFVHEDDKVVKVGKVVKVRPAYILAEALDPGQFPALCLRIYLGDVEYVDIYRLIKHGQSPPA